MYAPHRSPFWIEVESATVVCANDDGLAIGTRTHCHNRSSRHHHTHATRHTMALQFDGNSHKSIRHSLRMRWIVLMPSNKWNLNEQLKEPHHFRLNVVSSIQNNNNALVWIGRFVYGQKTKDMECFVVVWVIGVCARTAGLYVCVREKHLVWIQMRGATLAPFGTVRPIDNVDRIDALINHHRHNDLHSKWNNQSFVLFSSFYGKFNGEIYWEISYEIFCFLDGCPSLISESVSS